MSAKTTTVAGVMSGTSADGIDVAVVRIAPSKARPKITLLAHEGFKFSAALRRAVLAAMNAKSTSTAELARLNWRLGLAYAEAVKETVRRHEVKLDLVGCHGQTLYHQARAEAYAGRRFACTWQAGEAQAIAAALRVPVVSNFRPADMLAGGEGAGIVPAAGKGIQPGRNGLLGTGAAADQEYHRPGGERERGERVSAGFGDAILVELAQREAD